MNAQQNQCVYAMDAHSDFSVYKCKREGCTDNLSCRCEIGLTQANARAASGIPTAPNLGVTCPPTPRERETSSQGFPTWSVIIDSRRRCRPPASQPGSSKAESMAGPLIFESICVSAGNTLNVTSALPHSNRSPTPVLFVAAGICEHLL